jgi:transglutaminase-like putative cysteine protease
MKLSIVHETRYQYTPAVQTAQHMLYLTPRHHEQQTCLSSVIDVQPRPDTLSQAMDVFGNTRHFVALNSAHEALLVRASSRVQTQASGIPTSRIGWEAAREQFNYRAGHHFDPAETFVFASPMVPCQAAFAEYARASFAPGRSLLQASLDLMQRIYQEFQYEQHSTEVHTPALHALQQRAGVCQDFAHILIACLRSLGLSARYVSGYLLTRPPPGMPRLRGSDASHAWASVYLPDGPPGQRWLDLDPTNNRAGWPSPGEDYVTLATGRDFSDVSPLRGVIHGGADHTLQVAVTVEPLEEPSGH